MDGYASIMFSFVAFGAGAECIVIIFDYVFTSLLSQLGRG